jgi:flagellar M-ring protein FliF
LDKITEQLKSFYEGLEPSRQKQLWVAIAAAVALVIGVGVWAQQGSWHTIRFGSVDQATSAMAALSAQDVSFKVGDDGLSLLVPDLQVGKAQEAMLESQSLPSYWDLEDAPLGLPPRVQDWAMLRNREGELMGALNAIEWIDGSQVAVSPGQEGLFVGDEVPAKASVQVRVREGYRPSRAQIQGIVHLIASGVENLDPDEVTIVDQTGLALHQPEAEGFDQVGEAQLRYQRMQEKLVVQNVTTVLSGVVGNPNDLSVTATVEVDHTQLYRKSLDHDPDKQVTVSEQLSESAHENTPTGGAAGASSNNPEALVKEAGRNESSESLKTTVTYKVPETMTEERRDVGSIQRVTVAVSVDAARVRELAIASLNARLGPEVELEQAQIDAEITDLKAQLESMVKAAAGIDDARGDAVQLAVLHFAPVPVAEQVPVTTASVVLPWMPYLVAVMVLALTFGLVIRPLVKSVTRPVEQPSDASVDGGDSGEDSEDEDEDGHDLAARLRLLVENYEPVDADDLNKLVDREIEAAAKVVRLWSKG